MSAVSSVDDILELADGARDPTAARAAVFDADGTIWAGDIGDEAFAHAMDEGLVTAETWARVSTWASQYGVTLSDFASLASMVLSGELLEIAKRRGVDDNAFRSSLYEMQAWAYAGHARSEILAYGRRIFERGFAQGIFADMRRLIDGLRERDVTIVIVSASHGALVEASREILGVKHVRGMEPAVDDNGITQPAIAFSTYGPGKVRASNDVLGGAPPLLAFGDSVCFTDRELLAHAKIPVAVNTRGVHREAAMNQGMLLLDPAGREPA